MDVLVDKVMIIVLGLPGTGKTTFAKALASAIGAKHISSDALRFETGRKGKYDLKSKSRIYDLILDHAIDFLDKGQSVVLDGTFSREEWRTRFRNTAQKKSWSLYWMVIEAEENIVQQRVSQKRESSEADFSVYQKVRDEFDPVRDEHLILQSDKYSVESLVQKALLYLSNVTL